MYCTILYLRLVSQSALSFTFPSGNLKGSIQPQLSPIRKHTTLEAEKKITHLHTQTFNHQQPLNPPPQPPTSYHEQYRQPFTPRRNRRPDSDNHKPQYPSLEPLYSPTTPQSTSTSQVGPPKQQARSPLPQPFDTQGDKGKHNITSVSTLQNNQIYQYQPLPYSPAHLHFTMADALAGKLESTTLG